MKESLIDQYRDRLIRVGKSPHTVKAYIHDVAAFASWFHQTTGEVFDPQVVDPREIQEYRGYLLRQGRKPATINRRLIALRSFFRWAVQKGLATESPFEAMEKVLVKQQKDTSPRWLDRKEQLALVRAVKKRGRTRGCSGSRARFVRNG